MKITTFILIFSLMQVSAASFGQKLNLKGGNATIEKVLREIKKQTNYDVLVESTTFNTSSRISANFVNAPLETVMDALVAGTDMTYVIENKNIVIRHKEKSIFERLLNKIQAMDVKGRILDDTGKPFPGASIKVKGASIRTASGEDGRFTLRNVEEGATIEISFIGYKTMEIKASAELGDIKMQMVVGNLTEVGVVSNGYQTLSRERSAGAFTKVDMDVVSNRTTSMNLLQSLDGQVPGLVVNNVPNRSQLLIRGLSTTGGSTGTGTTSQPLYVVDGLAVPVINGSDNIPDIVLSINPQDVKDITVLKDATAASIWGARAANGVIVITTKGGTFNSKLRVNYNGFVNFQGKPNLTYNNLLNASQFVASGTEIFNTPGYLAQYPYATVSALNGGGITPLELILYNKSLGKITADQANSALENLANTDNRDQIKDLFYRDAMLTNHTVSLSGGSEKYAFYGSASYTNTVSTVPGEKNENFKLNFSQDIQATKFLSFRIITDISNNVSSAKRNLNIDYYAPTYQLYRDANGNNLSVPFMTNISNEVLANAQARSRISLDYNPLNEFDYGSTKSDGLLARLNGSFKLNLFKGLRLEGTYGYIKGKNNIRDFESLQSYTVRKEIVQFAVAADPTVVPKYYLPTNGGRLTTFNGDQHKWDVRNQLIYDNTWGKHALTVLFGQEAQEQFQNSIQSRVRGFDETLLTSSSVDFLTISAPVLNTILPTISTLASSMINDSYSTNETTTRFTSYYANLGYTFDHKYTLNASWRNDQSNLFGKDKSAQNKPIWSAGAKWNISNENFMKEVNWVEGLALRLTYGLTGNSPEVGVAASRDITGPSGSAFFPGSIGMRVITPGNPLLSWERTATTNLGLDFSILNNRISAGIDLYQKKTTDLLGLVYPNSLTGFTSVVGNQGDITNKGIELNLLSQNIIGRNFSWSTNLIFAYNKSNVDKISTTTPITTGAQQVVTSVREGYPAYTLFAYQYGGLDNTGAPLVVLADGTVTKNRTVTKPEDIVYMGTLQPVWNGGLTNNFQYKNFRLSANIIYNMGHVMRRQRDLTFGGQFRRNVSVDFLSRWKVPGDEQFTNIPAYITNSNPNNGIIDNNYFLQGDVNVVKASFVKLRDITLFYEVPKFLAGKIKAQSITFRAQVSNVMLWKANKFGIDPEFQGVIAPTNQNTLTLGANISL